LLLLFPLAWLHGLVSERTALREQAIAAVARGWGGRQMLSGPILAIPVTTTTGDGHVRTSDWYVLPEAMNLDVELIVQNERRRLGVYEVPVYIAKVHATGRFDLAREIAKISVGTDSIQAHPDRGRLLIPISDPRGVRDISSAGDPLSQVRFEPGRGFPIAVLTAPLRMDVDPLDGKHAFDITLEVAGTQSLQFLPLAHASQVQLRGNWPDPGFASGFLPVERHARDGHFDATWKVLDLNRFLIPRWFVIDAFGRSGRRLIAFIFIAGGLHAFYTSQSQQSANLITGSRNVRFSAKREDLSQSVVCSALPRQWKAIYFSVARFVIIDHTLDTRE